MKSVPLTAYPRTLNRRGGVKKLRATGRIPAVIYGGQSTPQNLEVDRKSLEDLIHHSASENLLVDLAVDKDAKAKRLALVKEIQHYALTGQVVAESVGSAGSVSSPRRSAVSHPRDTSPRTSAS